MRKVYPNFVSILSVLFYPFFSDNHILIAGKFTSRIKILGTVKPHSDTASALYSEISFANQVSAANKFFSLYNQVSITNYVTPNPYHIYPPAKNKFSFHDKIVSNGKLASRILILIININIYLCSVPFQEGQSFFVCFASERLAVKFNLFHVCFIYKHKEISPCQYISSLPN